MDRAVLARVGNACAGRRHRPPAPHALHVDVPFQKQVGHMRSCLQRIEGNLIARIQEIIVMS